MDKIVHAALLLKQMMQHLLLEIFYDYKIIPMRFIKKLKNGKNF